jgi:4-carboxymuconolactone decarboxylase
MIHQHFILSSPARAEAAAVRSSMLDGLREEFPHLADAVTDHALGEAWMRQGIGPRTRQLATIAAFAATGNYAQVKVHAGYALNVGVGHEELKEIVYLTAVHAGLARAIEAAQALSDLFAERWETGQPLN